MDDPSNPFAGIGDPNPANHGLTFVYKLHNDAVSLNSIGRMTNIDFSAFLTDVSYQVPAAGLPSTSTDRSFGVGSVIGWSFTGAPSGLGRLAPGATTALLVVQTNAPGFVEVPANIIDGSVVQALSLGPSPQPNVPEPATIAFLAPLGVMLLRRSRAGH